MQHSFGGTTTPLFILITKKDVFNHFYRGLDGKKSIPVSYNPQMVQISMDLLSFFAQGQNF